MDTVAVEKEMAMLRYRRLRRLGALLRCLEIAAFVVLLSWSSFRLPAAARISGDFLRRLATLLLSPRCVFLIGNAIVIALIYNSGNLSSPFFGSESSSPSPSSAWDASGGRAGFYEEFLATRNRLSYALPPPQPETKEEEVVFEDKAVCVEKRRVCRRSRSDHMEQRRKLAPTPELRRSETDIGKKADKKQAAAAAAEAGSTTKVEEVDPEEFRRTIEAFIAKQAKFHWEESMAIVCADSGARNLLCSADSPELAISKPNDANQIEVSV